MRDAEMERDCFKRLLLKATCEALAFARQHVFNRVADDVRYAVEINDKCNVAIMCPSAESAVSILWHEGRIPIWIDVYVHDVKHHVTTVWLLASERNVLKYSDTYYADRGTGPFGVKSPHIPSPMGLLPKGTTHRFFLGNSWFQWQLNCLLFRWWALWMGCDAFHMKLYKENRWKRPKIREVRYVTA